MLTDSRTRAVLAAVAPTVRVASLGPAAATVGFASVPAFVAVLGADPSMSTPLLLVCLVGGATLGWAADDPAANVLAALPVPQATRTVLRILSVAVVSGTGVGLAALVLAVGPGLPPDRSARIAEAAAAGAVAVAVGLAVARRGERGTGPVGVTAGLFGTALVAALAVRWPTWLPTFGPGPTHSRWWLLTAVAAAAAVRVGRDPARS